MKVLFLDFDGVLNSMQSQAFWNIKRDQSLWENEMYSSWHGSLKEYIAHQFCPIAMSNVEQLLIRVPDIKIVVSSSWRHGETVETLKQILHPSKVIADAIIDVTPYFRGQKPRGAEIKDWLDRHPEVDRYVIVDDDADMLESQKNNFIKTSPLHGFQWGDMLYALRLFDEADKQY